MNIVKEVDCALIFMLDEERDLFLEHNNELIITTEKNNMFIEFIFFDKNMSLRKGVICSNGKKMGNSEAGQLFYVLSRKYKAHLYINLGVAGLIDEMNIGDVLVVDRLSTMGENNANNVEKQVVDLFRTNNKATQAVNDLNNYLKSFSADTANAVSEFKKQLKGLEVKTNIYKGFERNFKHNKIITGRCVTVPEVIKDINKMPELKKQRKTNLIDMEAYYVALWHDLVKANDKDNSFCDSEFLAFKSVSDYGDENKQKMELCGSRTIAMKNLATVVTAFCTKIYEYKQESNIKVYDFLSKEISQKSLDSIIDKSIKTEQIPTEDFECLFESFTNWDTKSLNEGVLTYAIKKLSKPKQALLLTGRSGTGKSTFLSYLYKNISKNKNSVLIDFSKFSSDTIPTDKQIVNLIEGLIIQNMDYLVFIDGLRVGTDVYNELKIVLDNHEYSNLGFCIGNIDDDYEDLYNIVSGQNNINEISFFGISVHHPQIEKLLNDSVLFFSHININYKKETIENLIKSGKLTSVDFRLLATFANYNQDLTSHKTFHGFIKSYISSKYTQDDIKNYWKNIINIKPSDISLLRDKIELNTYFASFSIAQNIINVFNENDENVVKSVLKMNYILSDDMNSIFEYILKNKRHYGKIVDNMIKALDKYESTISTETQLIYNISRTIPKDSQYYMRFEKLVAKKIDSVQKKLKDELDDNFYNYIIEYRTLAIVMNNCFEKKVFLQNYNKELLSNNQFFIRCNLAFHLFYYAKKAFDFDLLNEFEFRQSNYEMLSNSYFILVGNLNNSNNILINRLIGVDQQAIMNIITILNLLNNMIDSDMLVKDIIDSALKFTQELFDKIDVVSKKICENKIIEDIKDFTIKTQKKLKSIV